MASSSGNSSGSTRIQNSGSEDDLQLLMEQRKRKRMQSNRESARRSRLRKQKQLDDLTVQVAQLKKENNQILTNINITRQHYHNIEAQNSVLRAQMAELSQRLESLNDILCYMDTNSEVFGTQDIHIHTGPQTFMNNPWNLMYPNQPIVASADMFQNL